MGIRDWKDSHLSDRSPRDGGFSGPVSAPPGPLAPQTRGFRAVRTTILPIAGPALHKRPSHPLDCPIPTPSDDLCPPSPSPALPAPYLPQVIQPINGDPFIGMLETPVTSSPLVASYLSNLPAYRTGVSPLLRGVEIGLAHGFLLVGPFLKYGPLRAVEGTAEVSGCLAAAGVVAILTLCLSLYGSVTFQNEVPQVGVKTLSGRPIARDSLQSADGWSNFAAGFAVGGLSGVAWGYICTQILPYYS
jgi:photosystem I subunit 11